MAKGTIAPELDRLGIFPIFSKSEYDEDAERVPAEQNDPIKELVAEAKEAVPIDELEVAVPLLLASRIEGRGGNEPLLRKASEFNICVLGTELFRNWAAASLCDNMC